MWFMVFFLLHFFSFHCDECVVLFAFVVSCLCFHHICIIFYSIYVVDVIYRYDCMINLSF